MKIVAVIPARAGSKGVPNKNIRLINGKPMISYAIGNALNSKFITDVVVSTDSDMVKTIARQMGASVVDRSPELCGDAVTLDAVIYDAVKNIACDFVVTMQPTSPTLTVKTLDSAIEHAINKGLDTLISAHNKPHLAWTKDSDGQIIPCYKERLNRQYLPPYYEEAGAFVISRREIVTEKTRIGRKVEVFDIPESEAVDIDTFEDLAVASLILSKPKTAICVNSNGRRGMGNVYRALELADEFLSKPDIYFDTTRTEPTIFGATTHNLIPVNGIGDLLPRLHQGDYTLVINDTGDTTVDYMTSLRNEAKGAKIVNFEDCGEGASRADLVINSLIGSSAAENCRAGVRYYISPKLFSCYKPNEIRNRVTDVFVSFGGSDANDYTGRVLKIARKSKYAGVNFRVALGRMNANAVDLCSAARTIPNVKVVEGETIPEAMSKCDIAITSRGRTCCELAILGIPTISIGQNKREEMNSFVCEENGFSYLGVDPSDAMIEGMLDLYLGMTEDDRRRRQEKLLRHDLMNGRVRVMNLIRGL